MFLPEISEDLSWKDQNLMRFGMIFNDISAVNIIKVILEPCGCYQGDSCVFWFLPMLVSDLECMC